MEAASISLRQSTFWESLRRSTQDTESPDDTRFRAVDPAPKCLVERMAELANQGVVPSPPGRGCLGLRLQLCWPPQLSSFLPLKKKWRRFVHKLPSALTSKCLMCSFKSGEGKIHVTYYSLHQTPQQVP